MEEGDLRERREKEGEREGGERILSFFSGEWGRERGGKDKRREEEKGEREWERERREKEGGERENYFILSFLSEEWGRESGWKGERRRRGREQGKEREERKKGKRRGERERIISFFPSFPESGRRREKGKG